MLMFAPNGGLVACSSPPRCRASAAMAASSSCSRTRARTRSPTWTAWRTRLWAQAAQRKDLTGLLTTFSANDPQVLVTIDREKAKAMNIPLSQITTTLGVFMGSEYINDFDYNNRTYRVFVQADQPFRMTAKDLHNYYVRSDSGQMVPLDNLATVTESSGPPVITHYNLFRAVEIDGSPAPGYSSGQGIGVHGGLAKKS
jgi:HAE1 family hydrophobic/amphiphilic exporter-1